MRFVSRDLTTPLHGSEAGAREEGMPIALGWMADSNRVGSPVSAQNFNSAESSAYIRLMAIVVE